MMCHTHRLLIGQHQTVRAIVEEIQLRGLDFQMNSLDHQYLQVHFQVNCLSNILFKLSSMNSLNLFP